MLTQHNLSFFVKTIWGIIYLQYCNKCHLPSDFSSKFQASMTTLHHKLLTREGRVVANGWTHPSSMTLNNVQLSIRFIIQKVAIVILNIIFSVVACASDNNGNLLHSMNWCLHKICFKMIFFSKLKYIS